MEFFNMLNALNSANFKKESDYISNMQIDQTVIARLVDTYDIRAMNVRGPTTTDVVTAVSSAIVATPTLDDDESTKAVTKEQRKKNKHKIDDDKYTKTNESLTKTSNNVALLLKLKKGSK